MAKITKMPSKAVISGFKGTLDFYVHDGIACVRSWPRSPGRNRAPAVQARWAAFAWAATNWYSQSQEVRDAYNQMATSTYMTGRDLFMKNFISAQYLELN